MALTNLVEALVVDHLKRLWRARLGPHPGAPGTDIVYGTQLTSGLRDQAATELVFDESQKDYIPASIVCDTATIDNRNGLAPHASVELSYTYAQSVSSSHSTSNSIKVGVGADIKGKATIFGTSERRSSIKSVSLRPRVIWFDTW